MNENSDEIVTTPITDGTFVETAFGRDDFRQVEEEENNRIYRDTSSAKALGVDSKAVRAWAKEKGLITASKGKMNKSIIALFKQSQGR